MSVHLVRGRERGIENDALAAATGGRVGLGAVLADLNRTGQVVAPPQAASYAFSWDEEDSRSRRWWPQGITSSSDASPDEQYDGRDVLVTTSYSKVVRKLGKGCRLSVVDVTNPDRVRYRHVLLVTAVLDGSGRVTLEPVNAHAGGIVWNGPYLHVAGTARGIHTFHVDDVVAVTGTDRPELLGPLPDGGMAGFGHRYVLPVRCAHKAVTEKGVEPLRYSFLSLTRETGAPELVAGEYGRGRMTTRLLRLGLGPTGLPTADPAGASRPRLVDPGGVERMQGAVSVEGRLYVTTSAGTRGMGSIWVGEPGGLRKYPYSLPPGPEDICYRPRGDRLWTVTEYPRRRFVLALDRGHFG
ncbi:MAG TPA: hypothetical protein VFG72_17335 [Marmoricola sp.]|nr:hypothetical protein [Marmoricola sp.]